MLEDPGEVQNLTGLYKDDMVYLKWQPPLYSVTPLESYNVRISN